MDVHIFIFIKHISVLIIDFDTYNVLEIFQIIKPKVIKVHQNELKCIQVNSITFFEIMYFYQPGSPTTLPSLTVAMRRMML